MSYRAARPREQTSTPQLRWASASVYGERYMLARHRRRDEVCSMKAHSEESGTDDGRAERAAAGGSVKRDYVRSVFEQIAPSYDVLNHLLSMNIDRYDPDFKFSSWLFKIANNLAIDHLRRRQLPTISMHGAPDATTASRIEATAFDVASDGESALDELEARELGTAIEKAIASLRPEYRSCIMLRHVEGRSYEEIAATLDLPLGTVKTYIHRARHELRKALEGVR